MRIVIPEPIDQKGKTYLLEKGYELDDRRLTTAEQLRESIRDSDALLIRILPCGRDVLETAARLKVVSKHGVGVDNIDVDFCTQHNIQITFAPEAVTDAVAEHALYLIFACAKNATATVRRFVDNGDFEIRNTLAGVELTGKTVGLLGLGRIGRALAQRCLGIGMEVVAYDPFVSSNSLPPHIRLLDRDEVLRQADFVSMHLPCNDQTRGGFASREFAMMKQSAFFINVSRGGVVRESDMIDALRNGIIRGAGIDVFEQEPVSPDNPLLHMDNVIATPHQAGSTVETREKVSLHAAMGIDEVLSGKKLSWPLNRLG